MVIRRIEFVFNCQIDDAPLFTDELSRLDSLDLVSRVLIGRSHALPPTDWPTQLRGRDRDVITTFSWLLLELDRTFMQIAGNWRLLNNRVSFTWRGKAWGSLYYASTASISCDVKSSIGLGFLVQGCL